jgi:putative ABC transport system permease protein
MGARDRPGWQFAAALVFLAGGAATVAAAPAAAALGIAGLVALTVAMLLSLPSLLAASVAGVDFATRRVASVVPFIAMFDLRDRATRVRSLAVAATGAVAVFGSVALQGAHGDLERGLDHTTADVVSMGDVWALVPGKANLLVTTPFAVPRLPAVIDGVERVRVYRGGFLDIGDRRVSVFGPPAAGPMPLSSTQILDGDLDRATARLREGGWVVVSKGLAREQDLQIGDLFEVPSPAPVSLRVAALSTNLGWPPGAIVMNAEDYRRAWGSADASALLATARPGTSAAAARRSLAAALHGRGALTVMTAEERQAEQRAATRAALDRLAQISRLVLLSAIIAMASVMGGLIWQRRTFLAGVKIDGYATAQMWKALVLEAAVLIGTGCLLGGLVGLLGQSLLSRALTSVTGFPVEHSVAFSGAILTSLIVTASAVVVVAAFGHRAASIAPERGLTV